MKRLFLWLAIIYPCLAKSFPESVVHGYSQCTTCHVSVSGGGLLNRYGRSLSRELFSQWSYAREEEILHGLAAKPNDEKAEETKSSAWILGGDLRAIQRQLDSEKSSTKEAFLMQSQLKLGYIDSAWQVWGSFGKIEDPKHLKKFSAVSPEYQLSVKLSEDLVLSLGRFEPIYGLRLSEHNLWIRSAVGIQPWFEKDTIEMVFMGENQTVSLSGSQSTSATVANYQNTNYTISLYQRLREKSRLGLSARNSEGQESRQKLLSVNAILTLSESIFSLAEFARCSNNGLITEAQFFRLNYELQRGLTPFFQAQGLSGAEQPSQAKIGIGLSWRPRPHWDFTLNVDETNTQATKTQDTIFVTHYYL